MRTRKTGGKDTAENRSNWERYWKKTHPKYNPSMNYPGMTKTIRGFAPVQYKELNTPNTYIIQRHGFSCANLEKTKGGKLHARIADPSLTTYGIFSLLREQKKPEKFDGIIFVSSLVRTWQTGMLEYGRHGPLTIVVSPYIKEKHGFMLDLSNLPLPFEQQMSKMEQFMQFVKGIDSPIAREIISHPHVIEYNGKEYPLGPYQLPLKVTTQIPVQSSTDLYQQILRQEPLPSSTIPDYASQGTYVESLKESPLVSTSLPLNQNALIPDIAIIPEPSLKQYYGAEGFVYFDHWVRKNYDMKFIFVVSHSKWMQTVVKQYSGEVDTPIFNENAWKLTITPIRYKTGSNFQFDITPGIPKPTNVSSMNRREEPTCQEPPVRPLPEPVSYQEYAEQFAEESEPVDFTDLERSESQESQSSQSSQVSLNSEATPVVSKWKTVPVTNQKTEVITRSYTELVHMLCDRSLSTGLNALMASNKDFKTKVMHYIYSNPFVMVSDPTSYFRKVPIYLFENHYLAFVLLCKPYFDTFVQGLETSHSFVQSILSFFNLTVPIPVIVAFLKELQKIIQEDQEVYHLLISRCTTNANKHYAFKAGRSLLSHTLLDLFIYELDVFPVTTETIDFMYQCIIDFVRYGARCSAVHYSQNAPRSLFEMATGMELPSAAIVPFTMPIVELEWLHREADIIQEWEITKHEIDQNGILSTYQQKYEEVKRKLRIEERNVQVQYNKANYDLTKLNQLQQSFLVKNQPLFAQLEQLKKEYRETKTRLDPQNKWLTARTKMHREFDQSIYSYLNQRLAEHVEPSVQEQHRIIFKKFLQPEYTEPSVSIGGLRGTSWKKTLLRQSSVKAGRYRASLYKGKRRTRANRS